MKKGFTAGNFDILHPGYIQLFKECKANCDHFTILLQTDPSIERPEKLQPILSTEERIEQLMSNVYVDEVLVYTYEKDLLELIQENDFGIRFLGDDYIGKSYTGDQFGILLSLDIDYVYVSVFAKGLNFTASRDPVQ